MRSLAGGLAGGAARWRRSASSCCARRLGRAVGAPRIGSFYLRAQPTSPWIDGRCVLLATVLAVATPIKIWNNARIEHRLQEQEKLLLAAKIEALASQINPHFLFNTLTSISSLIRTQPETARMLITKLSGPPAPADAEHRSFRDAAGGARVDRRVPRHRGRAVRPAAERREADQPGHAGRHRAEHDRSSRWSRTRSSTGWRARSAGAGLRSGAMLRDGHAVIEVHDDGLGHERRTAWSAPWAAASA